MGKVSRNSFLKLAQAQHATGGISQQVQNSVKRPSIRIHSNSTNIAGVEIPTLVTKQSALDFSNVLLIIVKVFR